MADPQQGRSDWVESGYLYAWGLPKIVLVVGFVLPDPIRILVCATALVWMGVVCFANARRCGRTHCVFTGPFYLLMAAAVPVHGFGVVSLGESGWLWIGLTTVAGAALLWIVPERLFGPYLRLHTVANR